jgi:HEAT repeat protein
MSRARFLPLLANLALSLVASALLLAGLESLARSTETRAPKAEVAEYLWDWEKQWEGDFYTVGSNAAGWPPTQEFNADGVRDRAHPEDKLEGGWRVAILGDSVTLGAGVEAGEAYPQVLQSLLDAEGQRVDVMNVALWGWSTLQERYAYQRIARRYRPDQVILGVCLNDLAELQNNLSRPPPWLAWLHQRSALVRLVVNAEGREIGSVEELFSEPEAPRVKQAFERFFTELSALRDLVAKDGAAFSVLVFPFRFQLEATAPVPSAQRRILAFCEEQGIHCIDFLEPIRKAGPAAFVDYDHLSADGARLVASQIKASGLIPARPATPTLLMGRDVGDALTAALADPQAPVRAAAAVALGLRGASARAAAGALFERLGDPRQAVRWVAAQALYRIGLDAGEDVKRLTAALASDDPYVRSFAAWSLGGMGEAAAPALPALIEAYRTEEREGRGAAVSALGQLGSLAGAAVPALTEGLRNPANHRRWSAARALGRMGAFAKPAVPALVIALRDANEHVRTYAAQALGRLGVDAADAVPALTLAARDPDESVRREASAALKKIRGLGAAN